MSWGQSVQSIICPRDCVGDCPARILFLHLRDPVARIVGVVRRSAVLIGGDRAAVQRVIGIGAHLPLAIRDRGDIAIVVLRIRLGIQQGILSRSRSVHAVVGIDRLLGLGIGDGQEIIVGVIA
jgi:hypothetical protein